ncbi:MAG: histidine kinase dimerization/phospho-acceptor domain-containing protein, partial [Myxococcota bacterium]|nr:histidine kinase dimerization/phospho-acceptor domain-containing protein [Myxococcota bacterium]
MLPPLLIVSNPQLQYLISYDGEQICTVNHNQIQHWFSRNESGIIVLDLDLVGEENWEYKRNNFVQIGISSSVQILKNAQKLGVDYLLLKEVTLSEALNISIKSAYNNLMLHCRLQHLESKVEELEQQRGLSLLVGGIAHDFNNLLSIITGSARILSQNVSLSDTEKELLTNIIESSQHGRSISRQLMHFQQEKEQSCDLSSVLKRISRLLQQTLSSNMKLHVEPPATEILMRMSAVEVIRIIMNLTLNA